MLVALPKTQSNSTMTKRKAEELTVSELGRADSTNMHYVIADVSSMKKGKKVEYFNAKITDGRLKMSFQPGQRKKLQEKMETVIIENCEVRKGYQSEDLEIVMQSTSNIESSPTKLKIDKKQLTDGKFLLNDLDTEIDYQRVSVAAKVILLSDPI